MGSRKIRDKTRGNLVDSVWPFEALLDVMICRNVVMYLESRHRSSGLARLASRHAPDGVRPRERVEHPS